jgi:hypothetical protein
MKFIAELKDEQLLPVVYDIIEDVSDFVKTTNVLEIRKTLPPEGVTADEQGRKNIREMLRVICKEYPTQTAGILRKLWVPEGEETDRDKPNFIVSLSRLLNERWLIDFFISAQQLM